MAVNSKRVLLKIGKELLMAKLKVEGYNTRAENKGLLDPRSIL